MQRRNPPGTEEGWYAFHDLRTIDWDAWRDATERRRTVALEEGIEFLDRHAALADADEGASAVFTIVGHKADLLFIHLRPTLEHLDRIERRFESTAFAEFTEQTSSYVSVTEVSGYIHEDLTDGLDDIEDEGTRRYMQQRIYPEIPDADHVCFYPMDKRRGPEHNWYDLSFEQRAELMSAHGDIGREYAGKVTQIITGSVGLDDHEWGVTLFADDPTEIKSLLYEMRFDPSSSRYAEFGQFYVGRRFPPSDLGAVLAGDAVPTDEPLAGDTDPDDGIDAARSGNGTTTTDPDDTDDADEAEADAGSGGGGRPDVEATHEEVDVGELHERLAAVGVDLSAHSAAGYGLCFASDAPVDTLREEVDGLRSNFDHYDTHVLTSVESTDDGPVVVSLWKNERAASTASGFLADLPGVSTGIGSSIDSDDLSDAPDASEPDDTPEPADASETDDTADDAAAGGRPDVDASHETVDADTFRPRVERFGIDLSEFPAAGYGLLFTSETDAEELIEEVDGLRSNFDHYDTHVLTTVRADGGTTAVVSLWKNERAASTASGFLADLSGVGSGIGTTLDAVGDEPSETDVDSEDSTDAAKPAGIDDDVRAAFEEMNIYAGQPHGEDVYALVLYSEADAETLFSDLDALRKQFDRYDTHVKSAVYEAGGGDRSAVVSIWETESAAQTAGGFLEDLPDIVGRAGEDQSTFGTMGMFYTVKPEYREEFVETFDEVGGMLSEMDGHIDTRLMINHEAENDMFIASQWREREDAMAFFRSDSFRDTVEWGREVLEDRPRHVFLA
ncbi:MAG: heme-binding protein [Natronomonas sp.]